MGSQQALLAGASIGLAIAAPIGPMAIIVIRRTLAGGFLAGITTGAGASTSHLFYATLAVSGVNQIASYAQSNRRVLNVVIALVLIAFAVKMIRRGRAGAASVSSSGKSLIGNYASALALSLVNPMTFALLLSAVGAMTEFSTAGMIQIPSLAAGVFGGSIIWWLCLVAVTASIGVRLSARSMRTIDIIAGAVMVALAIGTISRVV